jgi:hypothetical protein
MLFHPEESAAPLILLDARDCTLDRCSRMHRAAVSPSRAFIALTIA